MVRAKRGERLALTAEQIKSAARQQMAERGIARALGITAPAIYNDFSLMSGWARIHGLVMLELFHHLGPVIGDPEAFYHYEMTVFLRSLGMQGYVWRAEGTITA